MNYTHTPAYTLTTSLKKSIDKNIQIYIKCRKIRTTLTDTSTTSQEISAIAIAAAYPKAKGNPFSYGIKKHQHPISTNPKKCYHTPPRTPSPKPKTSTQKTPYRPAHGTNQKKNLSNKKQLPTAWDKSTPAS